MFLRAFRLCSPEFIDDEISKIYSVAYKLKYEREFIDKTLNRAKKTFYNPINNFSFDSKNLLVLPYHDSFKSLPHILKKFNINVIFKNNNTIKKMLIKNSPPSGNGCVYKIPCEICEKCYYGQTSKDLETRVKQHKYCVRSGQESSAIFQHVKNYDHAINWNGTQPITYSRSFHHRNIIESAVIKHTFQENLNLSSGLYKLDPFIIDKIVSSMNNV